MSARNGADKQPKMKGLVKRCRSFKDDVMSRLARNRKDSSSNGSRKELASSSGWSNGGPSPIPSDMDPLVLISHRLKEAYLTLQFVESLIEKDCIDLLGGSSNVMLDLMGRLLNDIKGLSSLSDASAYQSTISQVMTALGDFLAAIDLLILRERCDDVQKELYFEKVLDALKATRVALNKLKTVVEAKPNGNLHHSVRHHSTSNATPSSSHPPLAASTPIKPERVRSEIPMSTQHFDGERRPPLPPKLRNWTGKSFDSEWPSSQHHPLAQFLNNSSSTSLSPPYHARLSQWLEQQCSVSDYDPHHVHHRSLSQHAHSRRTNLKGTSLNWTESAAYVGNHKDRTNGKGSHSTRTYSDSYQLEDSFESLNKLDYDARSGKSASTHNSQGLSLGSSLDNLLLVDGIERGPSPGNKVGASSNPHWGGHNSSSYYQDEDDSVFDNSNETTPPQLPEKKDPRHFKPSYHNDNTAIQRCPSPYENVDENDLISYHRAIEAGYQPDHVMSYSDSRNTLVGAGIHDPDGCERPPLPPKKKHSLIASYIEFLRNFEMNEHQRHAQFHSQLNHLEHMYQEASSSSSFHAEEQRSQFKSHRSMTIHNPGTVMSSFPEKSVSSSYAYRNFEDEFSEGEYHHPMTVVQEESGPAPSLPPKMRHRTTGSQATGSSVASCSERGQSPPNSPQPLPPPTYTSSETSHSHLTGTDMDIYMTDPRSILLLNEQPANNKSGPGSGGMSSRLGVMGSEGPDVKGGPPYALILYATTPEVKDDKFREVFLLTYRTFASPSDVVNLLWKRYQHFEKKSDPLSQSHAKSTLDLYVDVVSCLTPMDLEDDMVAKLRDSIYYLINNREIQSALNARKGMIQKYQVRQKLLNPKPQLPVAVTKGTQSLLQWNAISIAQQMTLLDAELFRQLEPAELLLWAREQTEDFCPALNHFTEHFNKVSYWARSKVLLCSNSRERNRTMKRMIQVMRKLREYNNFNSLLAILAALDSAPIRRLGFSRRLTEALKPHAALTDSSGSFRTYRQALAESKPPCIPYIGLVLQDLTFVHIGNADQLPDGRVNWVKRWQQCVVLEPVRRFHACHYGFVRNDLLLTFLRNFDDSLNDDELWQISCKIYKSLK